MTTTKDSNDNTDRDEAALARLLRLAGPRAEIPENTESRVYAKVFSEWQASTHAPDDARVYDRVHRSWKKQALRSWMLRWTLPLAAAASAVLIAIVVTQPEPVPAVGVGTVAKVISPVPGDSALLMGDEIYPGMTIETGAGQGYSFLLARNESLRLGESSTLRVESGDQFTLLRGRVYADTGEFVYRDGGLRIDTTFGAVTDIGTQFAVSLQDSYLDVAVREGRVDVRQDTHKFIAMSGERLALQDQGRVEMTELSMTDPFWNWTTDLAPTFDIEGKSLLEFLKWAARESGRILFFEDSDLRMEAMRIDLHGSIENFGPLEAISSVLATTAFSYHVEPDRIVIER